MATTPNELTVLQTVVKFPYALAYRELLDEIPGDFPRDKLHKTLEDLVEKALVEYGKSTIIGGVDCRTWQITTDGKIVVEANKPMKKNAPTVAPAPATTAPPTEVEEENMDILQLFDDGMKVIRMSIEASLATPVFTGDKPKTIQVLEQYAGVAKAFGDSTAEATFLDLANLVVKL